MAGLTPRFSRCAGCAKEIPYGDNFCSDECYYQFNPELAPRPPSTRRRTPIQANCFKCGAEFTTSGARYCSDACRQGAYRIRKGASPAIPPFLRLRFRVFERDRFRCRYCGRTPAEATLVIDHVLPVSKEGTWDIDNLVTACNECNLGKGDVILLLRRPP